jgi:hypothetical protein
MFSVAIAEIGTKIGRNLRDLKFRSAINEGSHRLRLPVELEALSKAVYTHRPAHSVSWLACG